MRATRGRGRAQALFGAALFAFMLASQGCAVAYLGHVSVGQARILLGRVSIEDRLASEDVSASEKEKLRFVLDVRRFGKESVGLRLNDSYTQVYDTEGDAAAWNLSACADDAFRPYEWSFPLVGTIPYVGYFDRAKAEDEAASLRANQMDVLVRPVAAYSTLGWFADPIFTPMLEYPDEELANVVLHELAHATVFVPSDADFNETLATFVGNQGALEYFRARGGASDPRLTAAADDDHDEALFAHEVSSLRERLDAVYQAPTPRAEKLRKKAELLAEFRERYRTAIRPLLRTDNHDWVLRRPINNALILTLERYHGELDVFLRLHRKLGSDLRKTVAKLGEIAKGPSARATLEGLAKE